jgi:hypothetical protein
VKKEITPDNIDIARVVFGAYQSYGEKPAAVEIDLYSDGTAVEQIFGQVNPCKFGDQCEGHACYCNCPNEDSPRKCRRSWYEGKVDEDKKCKNYQPNPYWQAGDGDFYQQRNKTLLYLKEQGLLTIEISKTKRIPDDFYKGRKSDLLD